MTKKADQGRASAADPKPVDPPPPGDDPRVKAIAPLFDAAFYLSGFAEGEAPADPIRHYLAEGWKHGRDPAPWFSGRDYLDLHADVAAAGVNPFFHYARYGAAEGRALNRAALPQGDPTPAAGAAKIKAIAPLFDTDFYLSGFAEGEAPADPVRHYLLEGWKQGRDPAPWFSGRDYLDLHADVAATGVNPFFHYARYGAAEGRALSRAAVPPVPAAEAAPAAGGAGGTLALVVGVHRSGTSLLTRGLIAAGADGGALPATWDPDNPDGFAEHPAVQAFNDRLLAHLGVSWDNWGFLASTVDFDAPGFAAWRDEAAAILRAAFVGPGPFVLKDPRTATLLPFWERVVPQAGFDLRRILILRDPAEVAESQRQRVARRPHEFPVIATSESMGALWAVTMIEVLSALSDDATLVVDHAALLAEPVATLAAAADHAGLAPDAATLNRFAAEGVKPGLYRARVPSDAAPVGAWLTAARALYADLVRAGTPRPLPAAEAHGIAAAQSYLRTLKPALSAVRDSIARLSALDAEKRARIDALDAAVRALAPLAAHAPPALQAAVLTRFAALAEGSDLARTSFSFAQAQAQLLISAGRRAEALAWLDRIRPQFAHLPAFGQLEQRAQGLPAA